MASSDESGVHMGSIRVALGCVWDFNENNLSRSLNSIHILYNHTPTARLRPHPELCCGFDIFNWTDSSRRYSIEYYLGSSSDYKACLDISGMVS